MTTPSGLPLSALQFWGAARGAVAGRASTAEFFQALRDAADQFGGATSVPDFRTANQLRSAAASVRNAGEAFQRSPGSNVIDAAQIGRVPYGRDLSAQASMPLYHVGVELTTFDVETYRYNTDYRTVQFAGTMVMTKDELLAAVGQDAEALAETYGQFYSSHRVVEILAA